MTDTTAIVTKLRALLAAAKWGLTPPPWKAHSYTATSGIVYYEVTNDAGDPRDEYGVFEEASRSVCELVAETVTSLPLLLSQLEVATADCTRLQKRVLELEALGNASATELLEKLWAAFKTPPKTEELL